MTGVILSWPALALALLLLFMVKKSPSGGKRKAGVSGEGWRRQQTASDLRFRKYAIQYRDRVYTNNGRMLAFCGVLDGGQLRKAPQQGT
ncbi:uncharacterized protein B0T15DRAFT_544268 [Chaetomium strumarium]|uniref:Uncharacterized protein n=1 Tax=Chaetomium strumarium TaxID=1170767 RepID=A0AAJ0LXW3_9PEZI|nr:hypothetical protein B0T15DRAFT_544268 [Chaetomium strumarium]